MTYREVATYARRTAGWGVAALGLTIPISTAGDSILLALILIAAAFAFSLVYAEARSLIVRVPPIAAAVALFAWLLIGCLYSSVPLREAFSAVAKYSDLALIPLLAWAAADARIRRHALACFAIAVLLNLYVSYSAAAGLPGMRSAVYPIGFKASVTHSLIVSLGAFMFLLHARETRSTKWRMTLWVLAALCAHNVLFIVIGRTGYVVLGLLLAYYAMTFFRGWRGPAVASATVLTLACAAYVSSENLQKRVDEIGSDMSQWRPGARDETSVGQRLEYYRTTLEIIRDHPLIGVGTGAFASAYAEKVHDTGARKTVNPHTDFLLIGAQLGIPGIVLRHAARLESRLHRDLARGLVITMAIGGLFNSLLLDHTEGLLFAWLTAVLYAGYNRAHGPTEERA